MSLRLSRRNLPVEAVALLLEDHLLRRQLSLLRDGNALRISLITLKPILEQQRRQLKEEFNGDIIRGGGDFARNLETTYGLKRGPGA